MTFHCAPKFVVAAVTFILVSVGLTTLPEGNAHAAPLTCGDVQGRTEDLKQQIINKLDESIAGKALSLQVAGRKIRINRVKDVYTNDACNLTFVMKVTLERRFLPDRHGTATVIANVSEPQANGSNEFEFQLNSPYVDDLDVSVLGYLNDIYKSWMTDFLRNHLPSTITVSR